MTNEVLLNVSRDYHWRGSGDTHTDYADALGLPNPFHAANWPSITDLGLPAQRTRSAARPILADHQLRADPGQRHQNPRQARIPVRLHTSRYEMIDKSSDSTAGAFAPTHWRLRSTTRPRLPPNPMATPQTGFGLANFELGVLNYNATFRRRWFHFRRQEYSPYFQDNWKVTQRLTLNLGLRYEIRTPLYDKDGTLLGFDFDKHALVTGTDVDKFVKLGMTTPAILTALRSFGGNLISYKDAGLPQKLVYHNWKQFGPRLGFAYRALDGKKAFVVRGGYRMSYYPQKLQDWVGSQSSSVPVGASFSEDGHAIRRFRRTGCRTTGCARFRSTSPASIRPIRSSTSTTRVSWRAASTSACSIRITPTAGSRTGT